MHKVSADARELLSRGDGEASLGLCLCLSQPSTALPVASVCANNHRDNPVCACGSVLRQIKLPESLSEILSAYV